MKHRKTNKISLFIKLSYLVKRNALFFLLSFAFFLRTYNIYWDMNFHLHPDERMLIMVAEKIKFFSHLNPNFFNYGSLPIYLLKLTSDIFTFFFSYPFNTYTGMLLVGRILSAFFDTFTVYLVYRLSYLISKNSIYAFYSMFLYSIFVFPIQNAHFFISDTFLTFFLTFSIVMLILFLEKPTFLNLVFLSLGSATAVTTKFTGILLLPVVFMALSSTVIRINWKNKSLKWDKNALFLILNYTILFFLFSFLFMPYGFIKYQEFVKQISLQLKMNSNPFIFPYTLQYVDTAAYLYYAKNIFFYGVGPILGTLIILAVILLGYHLYKKISVEKITDSFFKKIFTPPLIISCLFFLLYAIIIGNSAVKFMRYMLPLYPYLALLAGYAVYILQNSLKRIFSSSKLLYYGSVFFGACIISIWTISFFSIYTTTHTRIQASEWIYKNIPAGATLAIEHWDDILPLPLQKINAIDHGYRFETLELYNPDTREKWEKINNQLARTDYIIIASNRLYRPLMRLTDCTKLPASKCYPFTSSYYKNLFSGNSQFQKIKEFSSYPRITFLGITIEFPDDKADESFTVYDHPKVIIFKKKI